MSVSVAELFAEHGCTLDPEAASYIAAQPDPQGFAREVFSAFLELPLHLTVDRLRDVESLHRESLARPSGAPAPASARTVSAADYAAEVEVLFDAGRDETPAGEISDFVRYFNDRYDTLSKFLRRRREVAHAVPLARAHQAAREVALIGLVDSVSRSEKNGHRFIELEDNTGSATILVHASRGDLAATADSLVSDEVIGVVARRSKDGALLMAETILRPDLPLRPEPRATLEVPLNVAFLGDVHVGSKTFLADALRRALRWLHGNDGPQRERDLARRVKYLVLPGDVVDGVGVYPGQEHHLEVHDLLEQYRRLALELEAVPRHVHVVLLPGNHDAVRPSEPQPSFGKEIQRFFDGLETTFVSNPSAFSLHGRRHLAYHGFSMVDFATHVPGLSLERPTEIMRHMLQCRHLAPLYGAGTPILPEPRDRLVIGLEPDVFVTGHVHVAGLDRYKGVALVNAGTWQAQTTYQKMLNLTPTPAVLPIVDLATLATTRLSFAAGA